MIFDYKEKKEEFLSQLIKRRDYNEGMKEIEHDFANNVSLEQVIGASLEGEADALELKGRGNSDGMKQIEHDLADYVPLEQNNETPLELVSARVSDETDAVSYTEARTGMSARSSSGSWPGRGECAADIIDLDRYMRGSVRPHGRHRGNDDCDRLVVDAGGPTAVPGGPVGLPLGGPIGGSLGGAPSPRPKSSSTASVPRDKRYDSAGAPRDKRYSHDSGLSDGSYIRRRTHRRVMGDNATNRAHRDRERGRERDRERGRERTATSSNSMRTFRAACERALKDQQEQIARMAQICERLTVKNEQRGGGAPPRITSVSCTQDSSDISSSSISRSTRDKSRKDKHRTNECKTYKIIMNKLDELNRLFASRARSTPPPRRTIAPPPRASSGGSVSVSDKLVSTEPQERHHASKPPKSITAYAALTEVRPVLVSPRTPQSVAHSSQRRTPCLVERGVGAERNGRAVISRLATTHAHELDIAPVAALPRVPARTRSGRLNVATESVVECDSDADGSMDQSPHCKFDLDNPLHLYYQSKRLQNPQKKRIRAHSLDHDGSRMHSNKSHGDHAPYVSLCGRCQGYWRTLTTLATQLFYGSDNDKNPDI